MGAPKTTDADRIARYLHLCEVLPARVVDAANADASEMLASYKRDALVEMLGPFRTLDERDESASPALFGRLLRRAVRYRLNLDPGSSPATGDPRDSVNPILALLMMGAGLFFIHWFMVSPVLRSYIHAQPHDELIEERTWIEHPDPRPDGWLYAGHSKQGTPHEDASGSDGSW